MSEPKSAREFAIELLRHIENDALPEDIELEDDLAQHLESWAAEREAGLRAELAEVIHERTPKENEAHNLRAEVEALREALDNMVDEAADAIGRDAYLDGTTERNTRNLAARRNDLKEARTLLATKGDNNEATKL